MKQSWCCHEGILNLWLPAVVRWIYLKEDAINHVNQLYTRKGDTEVSWGRVLLRNLSTSSCMVSILPVYPTKVCCTSSYSPASQCTPYTCRFNVSLEGFPCILIFDKQLQSIASSIHGLLRAILWAASPFFNCIADNDITKSTAPSQTSQVAME